MAKNTLFRNAIGGYNKDDVNAYIADLAVQYSDKEDELKSEIKALNNELEEKLTSLKKENEDLTNAIKAQGDELGKQKESYSALIAEKDALEIRNNEQNDRIGGLTEENARLRAEIEFKAGQVDAMKKEVEEAKKALEEEQAGFEARAEQMLAQIQAQAKSVIEKATETAELIVSSAKKRATDISNSEPTAGITYEDASSPKKKDSLSGMLDSHKSKMDSFFASITKSLFGDNK